MQYGVIDVVVIDAAHNPLGFRAAATVAPSGGASVLIMGERRKNKDAQVAEFTKILAFLRNLHIRESWRLPLRLHLCSIPEWGEVVWERKSKGLVSWPV